MDEPPAAIYGSVRPVSGITSVMPPTTVNTWNAMVNTRPEDSSLPKPSLTFMAVMNPEAMMMIYSSRMPKQPTRPNSSPNEA